MLQTHSKKQFADKRITFFVALPALILLMSLIVTNIYNMYNNKKSIRSFYEATLKQTAEASETKIINAIQATQLLSYDEQFISLLKNSDMLSEDLNVMKAANVLKNITETCAAVENAMVVDSENGYVYHEEGRTELDQYFKNRYIYEDYPDNYWRTIQFFGSDAYRILAPTTRTFDGKEDKVIPIVLRRLNQYRLSNMLIINIRLDQLMSFDESEFFTENTQKYMLNRYSGQIFSVRRDITEQNILDTELYNLLVSGPSCFDNKFDGTNKAYIVSYSTSDNLVGYTYFVVVPYRDIYNAQKGQLAVEGAMLLIFILLSVAALRGSVVQIMLPTKKLARKIGVTDETDLFEKVEHGLDDILNRNKTLTMTLPYAQEKYLINFLNTSGYMIDAAAQEVIKNTLPFRYDYFAVVILQLAPTDSFFEKYSTSDYENIRLGFYSVVKEIFSVDYDIFPLSSEKDSIYIIVNMQNDQEREQLDEHLTKIRELLKNDERDVDLLVGLGGIYPGLDGMKKAHTEALSAMKAMPKERPLISFSDRRERLRFTDRDEKELFNLLAGGRTEDAIALIQKVLKENGNLSDVSRKQLYTRFMNVILEVRNVKKKDYGGKPDFEIYAQIVNQRPEEVYQEMVLLCNSMSEKQLKKNARLDWQDIIQYINEHYTDVNITLDALADHFHTKANYLSTLIKTNLGIGFKDYIVQLRVEQAKKLLLETDQNMQQIYESVGFTSKQSFFRMFKNTVGLTPGEYRKRN